MYEGPGGPSAPCFTIVSTWNSRTENLRHPAAKLLPGPTPRRTCSNFSWKGFRWFQHTSAVFNQSKANFRYLSTSHTAPSNPCEVDSPNKTKLIQNTYTQASPSCAKIVAVFGARENIFSLSSVLPSKMTTNFVQFFPRILCAESSKLRSTACSEEGLPHRRSVCGRPA